MNQDFLNDYFANTWKGSFNEYLYSGYALVDKIQPNEWVLDVGCGWNNFKDKIPNLVGIDPAGMGADITVGIDEYKPSRLFDVAFCLGSINFGDEDRIVKQIEKVVACLKPWGRIYWRCNPGLKDHGNNRVVQVEFFDWSFEKQAEMADRFGFKIAEMRWDQGKRIYAEWIRI